MNISLLIAHPNPASFNHAIAETTIERLRMNNHQVFYHDLYAEQFDPILPSDEIPSDAEIPDEIVNHCNEISNADGIIIVHPNWWGQPPAILKGWVDRVIRPGVAYNFEEGDSGEGVPIGLLKAHTAIVFNTANTPSEREQRVFGDSLQLLWKNCIFHLCGVKQFHRDMFTVVVTSTLEQRLTWLRQVEQVVEQFFPAL
ncbi:NAD(P)H-dependent oxidoreductase [candidate division KSB1 bacterium]|nr:NAD(P)H-dependent oxidoreductase [candidate division KSB1 bacterium]